MTHQASSEAASSGTDVERLEGAAKARSTDDATDGPNANDECGSATAVHERGLGDVLKARLPLRPCHPRALLTLLEGLSLWNGSPLSVAIAAEPGSPSWLDSGLFGDELWPGESQLVRYEVVDHVRPKRLRGLGDFRGLRIPSRGGR